MCTKIFKNVKTRRNELIFSHHEILNYMKKKISLWKEFYLETGDTYTI